MYPGGRLTLCFYKYRSKIFVTSIFSIGIASQVFNCGCRALSNRRPDHRVVQARQLSSQGVDLLTRNQLRSAETCFSQAIKQCPTDERAHWGISQSLWLSGDRVASIHHMQEAIRLSGENPDYMVRLGEMYLEEGQITDARALAEKVLETRRNNATAWALLGNTWVSEREWDSALQAFHRSMLVQPDNPSVQLAVAEIYRQMGRPQRALATLERMGDQRPGVEINGEVQLAKGLALADLGRQAEAATALTAASERLPTTDLPRQLQLATAQHQIGRFEETKTTLARILNEYPEDSNALRLQSILHLSFEHIAATPLSENYGSSTTVR